MRKRSEKRIKTVSEKNRQNRRHFFIKKAAMAWALVLSMIVSLFSFDQEVHAESFAMTGAYQGGTVTITPTASGGGVNGYSKIGGYQVTYSIGPVDFTAYDSSNGSEFYVGNNLNASGGCSFWYAPNGNIWQDGIVQLGTISDGRSVGSAIVDQSSKTVQITYQVSSLSELPAFIGFAYQPAGGAYIHRSNSYGHDHHIWYYHGLNSVPVTNTGSFDSAAPSVTASVKASGKTVTVGGKTWGTKAVIEATATDSQSRPGNLYVYQGATKINSTSNGANATSLSASWEVAQNGTYSVKSDDKLGNMSSVKNVTVDLVDTVAPSIQGLHAQVDSGTVCKENTLTIMASDAGCGLAALPYKWNDGEWCSDSSFQATKNGTYTVTVRDALGNESQKSIEITNVDTTAPTIEDVKQTQISDEKIRITVTAKDNEGGAGLHETPYSFDGGTTWQKDNFIEVTKNDIYEIVVRDAFELEATHQEKVTGIKDKKEEPKDPGDGDDSHKPGKGDDSNKPGSGDDKKDDSGSTDGGNSGGGNGGSDDGGNSGGGTGGNSGKTDAKNSTDDTKKKSSGTKNKKTGNDIENFASVSGNNASNNTSFSYLNGQDQVQKSKSIAQEYELEPIASENDDADVETVEKTKGFQALSKTEKAILGILAFLALIGLAGLGAYLLLSYLQYTCEVYAVGEKRERIKLCRLPIKMHKDEWTVRLPADKMGTTGTGEYVFAFRPTFVKEESPCDVILHIDQKKVRELLNEEIVVRV